MLFIISFLTVVLFVNFLIPTKLENKATAQKELRKESLLIPSIGTNQKATFEWAGGRK